MQEWQLARSFLLQIGWSTSIPAVGKTPVDILFKTGNKFDSCDRSLSEATKGSMEKLLEAWSRHSLDLETEDIMGKMSTAPMEVDTEPSKASPPREATITTPSMARIDLTKDIDKPKAASMGLRDMFNCASRNLSRNIECADTILDLYTILDTFLRAMLQKGDPGTLQVVAQPLLLTLLVVFLRKKNKQLGTCTDLFDEMSRKLAEECRFPRSDPFWIGSMLENHYTAIKVSHSSFMRRNLVVEVLETLASNVIPGCPLYKYKCFDASLAIRKAEEMDLKLNHLTTLFDKWLGTFKRDFGSMPPNSFLDKGLWGLTNTINYLSPKAATSQPPRVERVGAALDKGMVDVLDLETKILKGRKASIEQNELFYHEGQYPFAVSGLMDDIPDLEHKKELLRKKFIVKDGMEGAIPLPLAWEALIRRTLSQGTDCHKVLGAWMISKVKSRLKDEVVGEIIPGCTYPFEGKWYTAAKKFFFHLFLAKGDMKENGFNTITGLNDLFKIMNKNFSIWQELPEEYRRELKEIAPMFSTLTPILTLHVHARKLIGFWNFMFEKHHDLLLNPPVGWEIGIQVVRKAAQTKLFQNFPSQAYVRVAKSSKQQTGADKLLTTFLVVRVIMDKAKIAWNKILLNTDSKVPRDLGPTLLEGYSWTMIAFLVSTTVATGLRSQNLSRTDSMNPSTLWTPAMVLKGMSKESFDIYTSEVLSKNHQAGDIREVGVPLRGYYMAEMDGVIPVQLLAIRLYMIRKWLFLAGLTLREKTFPLNDNVLFHWDKLELKREDWKREKPRPVTTHTWKQILGFVYKSYIPDDLNRQTITMNALRKMLVTVESGAGRGATRDVTGHKADSSLDHYILSVPWLNRILKGHDAMDRPIICRLILTFQAEYIQNHGRRPDLPQILQEFPLKRRLELVKHFRESEDTGIIRQKESLECVFWLKVLQLNPKDFSVSIDAFEALFREARKEVSEMICPESESEFSMPAENTAVLQVHREQGGVQDDRPGLQEIVRNGQEAGEPGAEDHGGI